MTRMMERSVDCNRQDYILPRQESDDFGRLIVENLAYIEKQCRKACEIEERWKPPKSLISADESTTELRAMHMDDAGRIDPDTLFNLVLDRLRADDYKVLRKFRKRSKLTTYLTAVIANLFIDTLRKNQGRNRTRERAKKMGPLGEKIHDLVFVKGYTVTEAHETLKTLTGILESPEEIESMVEKMRGGKAAALQRENPERHRQNQIEAALTTEDDPEAILAAKQRAEAGVRVLDETLAELNQEDRVILRMRFPVGDGEAKRPCEIAELLGMSEKAVDHRIRRVLTRCKEKMLRNGASLDDLVGE